MNRVKFFIIVPFYNVEAYFERCLDSLLSQSYKHFEVILINDGSTDKSQAIAMEYCKKDRRFILFNQNNQGQSIARNVGLDYIESLSPPPPHRQAKHYIFFVDSDDYLEPTALSRIYTQICSRDVDVLVYSAITARDPNTNNRVDFGYNVFPLSIQGTYTPHTLFQSLCQNPPFIIATTCAFVFNAEYVRTQRLRFIPSIIYEDAAFCTLGIVYARNIVVSHEHIYNYVLSSHSAMRAKPTRTRYLKQAYSYFMLLRAFVELEESSMDVGISNFIHHNAIHLAKECMRHLQFVGYTQDLGFSKSDILPYTSYLVGKYRFCYHFPRIYGFPKRLHLAIQALWKRFVGKA